MSKITAVPDSHDLVPMGYLHVPRRFHAEIDGDGFNVAIHVEIDGEQPRCRQLDVQATGDAEVTGELLRQIPVKRCVDWALMALVLKPHRIEDLPGVMSEELAEGLADHLRDLGQRETFMPASDEDRIAFYEQYVRHGRRPRRGSPVTDEHLTQVADVYRAAVERGDPPTQTVAEAMHAARSTAARWVGLARSRGLLGASLPGRAGEAPLKGGNA